MPDAESVGQERGIAMACAWKLHRRYCSYYGKRVSADSCKNCPSFISERHKCKQNKTEVVLRRTFFDARNKEIIAYAVIPTYANPESIDFDLTYCPFCGINLTKINKEKGNCNELQSW